MKLPLTTDVREGPMIGTSNLHFDELMIYTFNKPENRGTSLVRNQQMELQKLTGLYEQIKTIQRLPAGKMAG